MLLFLSYFSFLLFVLNVPDSLSAAAVRNQFACSFTTDSKFQPSRPTDIASNCWRLSIGLFYGAIDGMVTKSCVGKLSLNFLFLLNVLLYLKKLIWTLGMNIYDNIYNIETASVVWLLLLMSGDIESNPGHVNNLREYSAFGEFDKFHMK